MAVNGWGYWGKLTVRHGETIDIPISVAAGRRDFEVSLWWPETVTQIHNDLDVHLINPTGGTSASARAAASVFERTTATGPLAEGTWQIRIRGYRVPTDAQVVYWAAAIHF